MDLILNQLADYTENRFAMQKGTRRDGVSDNFADDGSGGGGGLDELCRAKIVKVFEQSEQALPWITQVVLALSNLLTSMVVADISGLIGAVFLFVKFIKTAAGKTHFWPIRSCGCRCLADYREIWTHHVLPVR